MKCVVMPRMGFRSVKYAKLFSHKDYAALKRYTLIIVGENPSKWRKKRANVLQFLTPRSIAMFRMERTLIHSPKKTTAQTCFSASRPTQHIGGINAIG